MKSRAIGVLGLLVLLVAQTSMVQAQAIPPSRIVVPEVPAALAVPEGHSVFLHGFAIGTQNYVCLPSGSGYAWRFLGPQATLYRTFKGELRQQITTHYLSPDTGEVPFARPTWQHSADSSRVWGRLVAASSDPMYVEGGAIPWLLLDVPVTAVGAEGGDALAGTSFIHRVNTSGGIAPATGCSNVAQVGLVAMVPYTTDYFFYRPNRTR